MPSSSKKHLGRLELFSEIQLGGGGEFFQARDTRNGQEVGVHILPFAGGIPMHFEPKHHRAAQLKHPNILEVRGLRAKADISYVVTAPIQGESLAMTLRRGPLAIPEAVDLADQIVQALDAAHAVNVIHGDLSPAHVLVDADGNAKVFGFSLAKLQWDEDEPPSEYVSPEAIRGQPVDARSDIFSFGSTLYEMLSGYSPFHRPTPAESARAIVEELADALPEKIPDDLVAVVARCIAKDPAERFQTAAELGGALRDLVVQSLADPVTELPPRVRRFHGWVNLGRTQWERVVERVTQLRRGRLSWTALGLAALAVLMAADLFVRVRAVGTGPTPVFQQLTFRQGPILRARFVDHAKSVAYTARFEGLPQTSYLLTPATGEVRDLKLPPSSAVVAVSSQGELAVRMLDGSLARMPLNGGDLVNEAPGVLDADFSPKGDALAIARFDSATSTFFLEYPVRHPLIQSGTPIDLVRVSPNGDRVAYSKVEGTEKWLWVVNRSGETHMLTGLGPGEAHRSLSWSSDGREIWFGATATKDRGMIQAITLDGKRRTVYWMPEAQLDDTGPSGEALVEMFRGWSGMRVRGASENRDSDLSWLGETVNVGLPAIGSQIFFTEQGSASGRVPGVYLRPRSGSPPVRLCDGSLIAVSPDGRWVSVYRAGPQPRYFLVPSYGGQEIPIEIPALENHTAAVIAWLPSGYLVWGNRPGAGKQHFDWNAGTGELKPVGPVSPSVGLASDDGAVLLASSPNGAVYEFPVRGGKPTQVQGLQPSDQLLRWAPGNGFVFAGSLSEGRRDFSIFKINVASGARTLWKRVDPDAPADSLAPAAITPDGNTYAYTYFRAQSELFLARGLK